MTDARLILPDSPSASKNSDPPESRRERTSLVMFLLLLGACLWLNVRMVEPYLLTLLMGGILAILVRPAHDFLLKHHFRPSASAALVSLAVICLVVGPVVLFTWLAIKQGVTFSQSLSQSSTFSLQTIVSHLSHWKPLRSVIGDPGAREAQVRTILQTGSQSASSAVLSLLTNIPELILQTILVAVICFYFLIDGTHFVLWLFNKVPLDPEVRIRIMESFKSTSISTIWSAMAGAVAQVSFLVVGFALLGVPAVFLAGGVAFILAWIPIVGSIPVWIAGMAYLYVQRTLTSALILGAIGIVAGIVDNIVRPWVLRGRGDMHSLVALIAIFGGINLFGIFGVFYGPILVALLISLLEAWPLVGKRFGITFDSKVELRP